MRISDPKIINTQNLEATVFFLLGGIKTVNDYRSVGSEYKRKILLNDTVVLTSSSLGMIGFRKLSQNKTVRAKVLKPAIETCYEQYNKLLKTNFVQKHFVGKFNNMFQLLKTPIEFSKSVIGDCLTNFGMVAFGLFSAIGGDLLLSKTGFGIHGVQEIMAEKKSQNAENSKPIKQLKQVEQFMSKNVDKVVQKDVREEMVLRVTDFPAFNVLTTSLIGLEGLNITDEEKHAKQVKNATKYLILNSMVPLLLLSTTSALTKTMKNIYRFPIMFSSLVLGTLLVKKNVEKHEKQAKNNA